ncbi:hypothetical protein HDU86_004192 [Geranomyces michiganensis]|nr:hypothetical protein HDU86_004192 [Geranomyces michiganensis]
MPSPTLFLAALASSAAFLAAAPATLAAPTPGNRLGYFAAASYEPATPKPPSWAATDDGYYERHYDIYKTVMCGEKEIPLLPEVVGQPGFGNAMLLVSKYDKTAVFEASHFNTAPVSKLHIHGPADAKHNSSVIFSLLPNDPSFKGTTENPIRSDPKKTPIKFDDEKLKLLAKGLMYVNVHTTEFPGGALRGQLLCASKHCSGAPESEVARFVDDGVCNRAIFGAGKGGHGDYNKKHGKENKEPVAEYHAPKKAAAYKPEPQEYSESQYGADNDYDSDYDNDYDDEEESYGESTYGEDNDDDYSYAGDYQPEEDDDDYVPEYADYARPPSSSYRHGAAAADYKPSHKPAKAHPDCSSAISFFKKTGSKTLIQCAEIACNPRQSPNYIARALYQCNALMESAKANNHGRIPKGW